MTGQPGSPPLRVERRGPVAVMTLDRPAARNAMSPELVCRLVDAFAAFAADPELRVAVVTGAGERAFSSGGDLALTLPLLTGARAPEDAWDRRVLAEPDLLARSTLKAGAVDKPVIAAVNGACLAGGFELMLGCDIRIAAGHATFGLPEVGLGLIPFAGTVVRLPRQIPHGRAMELLLTGEAIGADEALALGLVNRVAPGREVLPAAVALAERIAANGPVAIAAILRTVREAAGRPLEEAFALENAAMGRVMASEDAREGPAAFLAKRSPRFQGR